MEQTLQKALREVNTEATAVLNKDGEIIELSNISTDTEHKLGEADSSYQKVLFSFHSRISFNMVK